MLHLIKQRLTFKLLYFDVNVLNIYDIVLRH